MKISPLGSGSDYTPFLQHLGIASLNLGFGGESGGGSYHSQFDSFDHFIRFGDPGFAYGAALSKVTARATLRLANADILPFRFGPFAKNVETYRDEVMALLESTRTETERRNALVAAGAYTLAADPTETYVAPEARDEVPYIAFAPLQNAIMRLEESAKAYDAAVAATNGEPPEATARLNAALFGTERAMTSTDGLPRRPWFRHQIYAPGFYTGYGVKTLPGIREAIEQRDWDEATEQVERIAATLMRVADEIDEATALIGG